MSIELHSYNNNDIELEYLCCYNKDINVILELYRGKLFCHFLNEIINLFVNKFGTKIFSIKKSFKRTITNLISSWMFSLYASENFKADIDPFFPNNFKEINSMSETLEDLVKYDNFQDPEKLINEVLSKLVKSFEEQFVKLQNYKISKLYKINKNKYTITKKEIIQNRENGSFNFYKYSIEINFEVKDKKLIEILNNLLIPIDEYNKLQKIFKSLEYKMDDLIFILLFRYQLLGSNNHQLGVKPDIMSKMNKDYGLEFECFASSINCTFNHYCSVYYDIEKYFGSFGSFFNLTPIKGTFGLNPPYQKEIIETCLKKALNHLEESEKYDKNLTFIITIPIWDSVGKKLMKEEYNNELPQQNIDYGDFEIIKTVKESKYHKITRMIPKEKFTYVDHNYKLEKNKTIQNTYVIIISNNPETKKDFLESYDFS
jgi:hypothetical protein